MKNEFKTVYESQMKVTESNIFSIEVEEINQKPFIKVARRFINDVGEVGYLKGKSCFIPLNTKSVQWLSSELEKISVIAHKLEEQSKKEESTKKAAKKVDKPQETVSIGGLEVDLTSELLASLQTLLAQNTTKKAKNGGQKNVKK